MEDVRRGWVDENTDSDISQMELKKKYKYRLILDESYSFGMVGKHGRGVTEYYNIPVSLPLPVRCVGIDTACL